MQYLMVFYGVIVLIMQPCKLLRSFNQFGNKKIPVKMNTSPENPVLLSDLDLSEQFVLMTKANGFRTLDEILQFPVVKLLKLPKFDYHILHELVKLLTKLGLEDSLVEE